MTFTNLTHSSEKVPLTNAFVNEVFPTARNPNTAILRCTNVGSPFGIVKCCVEEMMGKDFVLLVYTFNYPVNSLFIICVRHTILGKIFTRQEIKMRRLSDLDIK